MSRVTHQIHSQQRPFYRPAAARRQVQTGMTHGSDSLASACLVLCTACAAGDDSERANAAFISATRLYEDCHWEFAFERVALLADHGHAPAAKLALLMLRYGSSLYGTSFNAKPAQVARWAQRVLRATSRATASPSSITASA